MAKKKKGKKHPFRNATSRAPRAANKPEEETPLKRLAYTAGGAAGTALAGSFLAHEGWAPRRSRPRSPRSAPVSHGRATRRRSAASARA